MNTTATMSGDLKNGSDIHGAEWTRRPLTQRVLLRLTKPVFILSAWGLATFAAWTAAMWHFHNPVFPDYLPAHTGPLSFLPRIFLSAMFGLVALTATLILCRVLLQGIDRALAAKSGGSGVFKSAWLNEAFTSEASASVPGVLLRHDGKPFELTFTPGLPAAGLSTGPCLYLTKDGSVHAGDVLWHSGNQVVRTTNPAGGLHTVFDIPASQVIGYSSASPRSL